MRREFGEVMAELARNDPRVYLLAMDVGYGIFDKLKRESPGHYLNFGPTEQATMGIASGMALEGLKPYVFSILPFTLERPFEQVKLDIVEQNVDVKIVGFWNYPTAGPTHFTRDPEGLCKILGLRYIQPADSSETRQALMETYLTTDPVFFHLRQNPK